jgi:aminoglycoside 3-N-acetyltransferase
MEVRGLSGHSTETKSIARTRSPRTRETLGRDLRALGVEPGMPLLVHAALGQIGWTVGGAESVIRALMDVLTPDGTLAMPSFSEQLSDPAGWSNPPVPQAWIEVIRAYMPAYDPLRTATRDMGRIAEAFRTWPDVKRSGHPTASLAAWGRHADEIVARHALDWPLGDETPMGAFYDLDGHVLLIGVGYNRNSSLHLAETRAKHLRTTRRTIPVARGNRVDWVEIKDVVDDESRLFPALGAAFEATGQVRIGPLGSADARLMSQRALVDFAVRWLDQALAPAG